MNTAYKIDVFYMMSQTQHVINMFLNFGIYSAPNITCKKVSFKKMTECKGYSHYVSSVDLERAFDRVCHAIQEFYFH